MKVYLAGNGGLVIFRSLNWDKTKCPVFLLQTFYDVRKYPEDRIKDMLQSCDEFLLDSGAFTFMSDNTKKVNWKEYVDEYINFINRYDIKNFFELDLYCLPDVGIKKTEKMRKYIEHKTGKKSIPVFHKICGIEYYRKLCEQYDYIAIGASGKNDSKWTKNTKVLKSLVKIANGYGTKVHGLGYTRLQNINKNDIGFYSVDSSSWIGSRFNSQYNFRNGMLYVSKCTKEGERLKDYKQLDRYNLKEWRKVQVEKSK